MTARRRTDDEDGRTVERIAEAVGEIDQRPVEAVGETDERPIEAGDGIADPIVGGTDLPGVEGGPTLRTNWHYRQ